MRGPLLTVAEANAILRVDGTRYALADAGMRWQDDEGQAWEHLVQAARDRLDEYERVRKSAAAERA